MTFTPEQARPDIPILNRVLPNGRNLVYLDNAATTQKPQQVINAISNFYETMNSNVHRAVHTLAAEATEAYEGARDKIAEWFGIGDGHLIFTAGTTEAINLAAYAWGRHNLVAGDVVVLTEMEHHSDIVPWQMLAQEREIEIRWVPLQVESSSLDMEVFAASMEGAKLVGCIHTSNVLGVRNPVEEVIRLAHSAGARVILDAAQAAPHDRLNIAELGADMVAVSAHKMCGPTGIGALMVNAETFAEMQPFIGGGDMVLEVFLDHSTYQEGVHRFEAGTPKIAEAIGWGAAIDWLAQWDIAEIHSHALGLARHTAAGLREIKGMRVFGEHGDGDGAVVSFIHDKLHSEDMAHMLDAHGIAVRTGHHCAQPLLRKLGLTSTNRVSFYLYNTMAEADFFLATVRDLVARFT